MLLKLAISNFAIIKSIVFEPNQSLNIITGETGAGKSIILDALGLILGSRADIKSSGNNEDEKCVVEGVFLLNKKKYQPLFEKLELDFEEETIIRREITGTGKSRSFINDTPASLAQIKTITSSLISIHSQHENSLLTSSEFQFNLLDSYAGLTVELRTYQQDFSSYKTYLEQLKLLQIQQQNLLKEKDYLTYLLNEFENAKLEPNEEEMLETELKLLSNAEAIESISGNIVNAIAESDQSVADVLSHLKSQLRQLSDVSVVSKEIYNRLESAIIELKDIASEAENLKQSALSDPERLEETNERLQLIQNLKRKHNVTEFNDLIVEEHKLSDKLIAIGNIDAELELLQNKINQKEKSMLQQAEQLHQSRLKHASKIEKEIKHLLNQLEMPKAEIKFELKDKSNFDDLGKTELNILFSANIGMPMQILSKVASGGELSRLALCFRSIEANNSDLSTLIFDEIDTGVSGKVADTIGLLFEKLSAKHQVIAITHLPQVASYGETHFMIGKKEENNKTVSYLKQLDKAGRIDELAKMLSGNIATDIARKNALELLKN